MEERAKRKLSAILSADVQGYSRLMGQDELATVRTLENYREIIAKVIRDYSGRVVDSPGDNVLAEFSSVVDAVESAVEIQKALTVKNKELPEDRRMEFRIGINLGDVIEQGERIYGDGVNVAARLEGLAEPGGVCISGTAFDQIGQKLSIGYEYLGEQEVKNIEKAVRVYRVLTQPEARGKVIGEKKPRPKLWKWASATAIIVLIVGGILVYLNFFRPPSVEPASVEKLAFPLPKEPSIAILPFQNLSNDPNQDYFSDGLTEEIITALSKVPQLFVIARDSTFTYKGKPVKIKQVAEEFGVQYVLEGSVRTSEDRVRITAQLVDAMNGRYLWSERYDRELKNIFAIQDEITIKIITALRVKLTTGDEARLTAKGTENLQTYLKFLQARELFFTQTKENNAQSRRLVEEIIEEEPGFPAAYALLGATHWMEVIYGSSESPEKSLKHAFELTKKAIALDDTHATAHSLLGWLYILVKRDYETGISECERAVEIAYNSASSHIWMGFLLTLAGRHEEAVRHAEQALRLNPQPEGWYYRFLGYTYFGVGNYEEAITAYKKALDRAPDDIVAHLALTTAYSWAGRLEQARTQAAEVLRINPRFYIKQRAETLPYKNQEDLDRYLDGLRKAGLPETPPLQLPDKPSIAVLPFVNMSGDPEQEYFGDGITEEIITALSKTPKLFVIARNSSFTYKGKPVKVQKLGRELGVRYVLEGSVRKANNKVRVTAQLVDANTGNHLWAERYDRDLKDIFAVQDEITMKVITALQVKLTSGEYARLFAKGTENLQAYLKLLQAYQPFYTVTREGFAEARRLCEEAIAMDQEYAAAYLWLGATHWMDVIMGSSKSPKESLNKAFKFINQAIALDDSYFEAHSALGFLYVMTKQYDKGVAECEQAIALGPSSATAHIWMSLVLTLSGRHEEAVTFAERALRLDPLSPGWYFRQLGQAYFWVGQYEKAIAAFKKALQQAPDDIITRLALTVAYSWAGRMDDAHTQAAEVLRINPKFSVKEQAKRTLYKNQTDRDRYLDGLRKAGLPETPPLPLPDKPSIAVLPFVNMSGDPEQEYFSDGIAEEIITALTKIPNMFVIARTSSFKYKGEEVDVRRVGRELGVRHVLEGSVRRGGDKVRITAQLIDAKTNQHLWAERYDRELKDIFALQDDITKKIIIALQVKMMPGDEGPIFAKGTNNLDAYLKVMEGRWHYTKWTKDGVFRALQPSQKAIELDPEYAYAYHQLSRIHDTILWLGWSKSPRESLRRSIELENKAISLDGSLAVAYAGLGYTLILARQYDEAIAAGEKALSLEPNSAHILYTHASILMYAGRNEESITLFEEALRLNPRPNNNLYRHFSNALANVGRYEEAITLLKKAIEHNPNDIFTYMVLASVGSMAGRKTEAQAAAKEVLRLNPKFYVAQVRKIRPDKDRAVAKRWCDTLTEAGLPENPH